jgi:sec-independent protein translocase protein TatC
MSDAETLGLTVVPPEDPGARDTGVMSLVDHLSELRTRIVRALVAVIAGAAVGFYFGDGIVAFLRAPLPIEGNLVVFDVGDAFAIRLRIALIVGIILAMPVIVWQIWAFVAPGLTPGERRTIRPWLVLAFVFFAIGVTIAWFVLPFAARFLLEFTGDDLTYVPDARRYFDFVSTIFLAFGLLLEFPIVLVALSRVGIVTSDLLRRSRRIFILGIAIFAAAVTPGGDLVSPGVLGITMFILYELTIVLIRRSGR